MGFGSFFNSWAYSEGFDDGNAGRKKNNTYFSSQDRAEYSIGYSDGEIKRRERQMFNWKDPTKVEVKVKKDTNPLYLILFLIFMFFFILHTVGTS
jgi:hypothetical protein